MPGELTCPHCGFRFALESPLATAFPGASGDLAQTLEVVIPPTVSGSDDDLAPSRYEFAIPPTADELAFRIDPERPSSPDPLRVATSEPSRGPADERSGQPARPSVRKSGPRLGVVLLASYASALTLAGLWLGLSGRLAGWQKSEMPRSGEEQVPAGLRADRSRRVEPPSPIRPDRITPIGTPIRVGSLELTPLALERGPVVLERTGIDGSHESREGADDALRLRLRLRNISDDAVFAPLDEAFVREPDRGLPTSFIQTDAGERIYPYPLAVESEWTIEGQAFRDLKPGESFETAVVGAPDSRGKVQGPATWRILVRTGIDQEETIGVRFDGEPTSPKRR